MGHERKIEGARGEDLAVAYLEHLGWTVLARNWRCRAGEIDIVARDAEGWAVVCEVKSRRGTGYGSPLEAITVEKAARLRGLAVEWARAQARPVGRLRCDAIGVLWHRDGTARVEHVRGLES